jgi:hypothetical protein
LTIYYYIDDVTIPRPNLAILLTFGLSLTVTVPASKTCSKCSVYKHQFKCNKLLYSSWNYNHRIKTNTIFCFLCTPFPSVTYWILETSMRWYVRHNKLYFWLSFRILHVSSACLLFVAFLCLSGINTGLSPVALLFLLQCTFSFLLQPLHLLHMTTDMTMSPSKYYSCSPFTPFLPLNITIETKFSRLFYS